MRPFPSSLKRLRFLSLDVLPPDNHPAVFRDSFFRLQKPVVFPRGVFLDLPARSKWFLGDRDSGRKSVPVPRLNYDYLDKYGDCHVQLELSQHSAAAPETRDSSESAETHSFTRSYAPLNLFFDWTRAAQQRGSSSSVSSPSENRTCAQDTRLYLAQCQLLDLHPDLRADLPTPSIISTAGKGDVYDTNIWMGLAPTYTPLHRDPNPNLFVQLAGKKVVRLLSPEGGQTVFERVRAELGKGGGKSHAAFRGEDMMQGHERKLLDQAVWVKQLESLNEGETQSDGYETSLEAGDGLFIPLGWWHSIKGEGEGVTASVSLANLPFQHVPPRIVVAPKFRVAPG